MNLIPEAQRKILVEPLATNYDVPASLVGGIINAESSWDSERIKHEPGYRWLVKQKPVYPCDQATEQMQQMTSWGLGQIMGAVARERGYVQAYCTGLLIPAINVEYVCRHLAWILKRMPRLEDAASAYNDGDMLEETDSPANKAYVAKVMAEAARLQQEGWR